MMIQHNMLAANTSRQKEITRKNNIKATEKLASGYRINRAADDAAGLSISEKMRGQIRGLEKASSNIQDGSRTTTAPISMANISTDPLVSAYAAYLTTAGDVVTIDTAKTSIKHDATMVDFNSVTATNIKDLVKPNNPQGFYSTCCTCTQRYSIKFVDTGSTPSSIDSSGGHMIFNINLNTLINDPTVDGTKFVDHFLSELASLSGNSEIKSDDGLESYGVQMLGHQQRYCRSRKSFRKRNHYCYFNRCSSKSRNTSYCYHTASSFVERNKLLS